MTRLTTPKQWVFSRETRLESGEHHIDALDIEGVPVRLCTKEHSGHASFHRRQRTRRRRMTRLAEPEQWVLCTK